MTLTRANRTRISGGTLGRTISARAAGEPARAPPGRSLGSGIASATDVAPRPRTANSTNGSTSGAGAHSASIPAISGPKALPPAWASEASSAARSSAGTGSSSTSAAAAAPLIIPTARPWIARAANSQPSAEATANATSPSVAVRNPAAITRRRPIRSDS